MSNQRYAASIPHTEATIAELRNDPAFAAEYQRAAMAELGQPEYQAVGLLALQDIAEASDHA